MSKKHGVRSYYDQYADKYDNFYEPIQNDKFSHLTQFLENSVVTYDLGGGSGLLSKWLDGFIINVDISLSMLYQGLANRSFQGIAADLEYLPLRSNIAKSIVSLTALQNTENLSKAIREIKRIFSKNGVCLITLLEKSVSSTEFEQHLVANNFKIQKIPYTGEDICFKIRT